MGLIRATGVHPLIAFCILFTLPATISRVENGGKFVTAHAHT